MIAEAAEFDYSGSQALKALREEGVETVLVNSNVATIQTSMRMADKVYLGPMQAWFVEKVIEAERPDGILLGFGGQTALSLGVELWDRGVLARYGVRVLGTPVEGIRKALSRRLFREAMIRAGVPVPPSRATSSPREAVEAMLDGIELSRAVSVPRGPGDIGESIGYIGYVTSGYMTRQDLTEQAVLSALVPRLAGWSERLIRVGELARVVGARV
jgi:carbamoylphosphate synthase large subunit